MNHSEHAGMQKALVQNTLQVGLIVADLRQAMKHYVEVLGIGPWHIYTIAAPQLTNATVHGKPEPYSMKLAVAQVGNVQWELIQPLTGRSVYREFLDSKGGGLHHVLVHVEDYDKTLQALQDRGMGVLMSGTWRGASFAYADTEKSLGAIVEFFKVDPGWVMSAPEETYP
jgi:methylmalonyl-CoA/ethylmalonyl-CoA epimerase